MERSRDITGIYWPMISRNVEHTSEGTPAARGLSDPFVPWQDPLNSSALASVGGAFAMNVDFQNVQSREVFGIVDSNLTHLMIREGDGGEVIWYVDAREIEGRMTNTLLVAPALMDQDDNGKVEVLAAITDGNQYQLALYEPRMNLTPSGFTFDKNAFYNERVWLSPPGTSGPIRFSSPCIHDITGDGVEDIIVGTGNALSAHYGNNGTRIWSLDIGPFGEVLSAPSIFKGSVSTSRIVVNSLSPAKQAIKTTVVNFQGQHLRNVTVTLGNPPLLHTHLGPVPAPVLCDVAGDGSNEVVVSYPSLSNLGKIVVYSYALDELAQVTGIPGYLESYPAACNIDADAQDELLVHSRYYTTSSRLRMASYEIYDNAGSLQSRSVWVVEVTGAGTNPLYSPPIACDLTGDTVPDGVFSGNGRLHAVSSDGNLLWNMTLQQTPFSSSGLIGDLGSDAFTDIYQDGYMVSQKNIDLKVEEPWETNIYLSNETPVDGSPVFVNCLVRNAGTSPAADVRVRFVEIPPSGTPSVIGYDQLEEVVTTSEAKVSWTPGSQGVHTIEVSLDPNGTIMETDETNNIGSRNFDVMPAFPDLELGWIRFLRGDGREAGERRLVESDPSIILARVMNIGQKASPQSALRVLVDGSAPSGGAELTDIGPLEPGQEANVSIQWTPPSIPDGTSQKEHDVEVFMDPQGIVQELDENNNYLMNSTWVKNDTPVGGFVLEGTTLSSGGIPEDDVRVIATLERTGESLSMLTDAQGAFSFNMALLGFRDADLVNVHANKGNTWGEETVRIYSEDGRGSVDVTLTDIPTLSLVLTPIGATELEVAPGSKVEARFMAENTGNLPGNVTLTRDITGNMSLSPSSIVLNPSTFTLQPGTSREVRLTVNVPSGEPPGNTAEIAVDGVLTGNGTASALVLYRLTVKRSQEVMSEFRSDRNRTVDPNIDNTTEFEIYLFNKGNVGSSYNVSVDQTLAPYSTVSSPSGELDPEESTIVIVEVAMTGSVKTLKGEINLRTSGTSTVKSWEISIVKQLPNVEAVGPIGTDPARPILGQRISLIATVSNTGMTDARDVEVAFYDGAEEIGTVTVPKVIKGEETAVTGVDWEPEGIGVHVLKLVVDPGSALIESDEDDNVLTKSLEFRPDLSIMSVVPDREEVGAGEPLKLTATVKNEGNAPLSSGYKVAVLLGGPAGTEIGGANSNSDLPPGSEEQGIVEVQLSAPSKGGSYIFFIKVSPQEASDGDADPTDDTYELKDFNVIGGKGPKVNYIYFIVGASVGLVLVICVVAFLLWKRGVEIAPPPEGGAEAPSSGTTEEISIEAEPSEEGIIFAEGEGEPVLEMALESPAPATEEDVVVAEVVEVSGEEGDQAQEEGIIPEV